MYFLNSQRTLCHIIEDMRSGEAPDPCGAKADRADIVRYHKGKENRLLAEKPAHIPLCKHCQKGLIWARAV